MSDRIPDWEDMPDGVSLVTLSWEDVYVKARKELLRNPTREETLKIFDDIAHPMSNAVQDDMPAHLDALIEEMVKECLKSKPYSIDSMSPEELVSRKYCHTCQDIQETYWELGVCEKNPEGLCIPKDHGNDKDGIIECSDEWCNPTQQTVETQITKEFVQSHNVDERCAQCHRMLESQ